jgi:hypothetical protein
LWGGVGDELKFYVVSWFKICTPLSSRGLGVRFLVQFNRTLLKKWLWCYVAERKSLWRLVLKTKYDRIMGDWCSKEIRSFWSGSVEEIS